MGHKFGEGIVLEIMLGKTYEVDSDNPLIDNLKNNALTRKRSQLTGKLSGKRSPHNPTPKYYNLVRSNDVLYIDRFTKLFSAGTHLIPELAN